MKRIRNMQAWGDEKNLISYNTSIAQIIEKDGHKWLILRDYNTITSKKHLRTWLDDMAYLTEYERNYIINELKYYRQKGRSKYHDYYNYYIFTLERPFDEGDPMAWLGFVSEVFNCRCYFITSDSYHKILQYGTPTI